MTVLFETIVRDASSVNVPAIVISVDEIDVVVVIVEAEDISAYLILSQSVFKSLDGHWVVHRCPIYDLVTITSKPPDGRSAVRKGLTSIFKCSGH